MPQRPVSSASPSPPRTYQSPIELESNSLQINDFHHEFLEKMLATNACLRVQVR
jgi:hypothetical protein